ncbi:hypothetical protein E4U55_005840 [Claviceps digitariae]|nr:hypothetical protein E4U55_005840 [Claviceps digitariae]
MGVGRFVCVGLPLALTIASIVALLIATLSGVAHNQMWMFQLDMQNLSISPADAAHLAGKAGIHLRDIKTDNISAANLNLANVYEVNLWGYCSTGSDGQRQCTEAKFNWAATALNTSLIESVTSATGIKIELPDEIKTSLKTFRVVTKWTQVAFIVALVALGVQFVLGIFAMYSRAVSCLIWLMSSVTAILVGVAAGMATAMATVVVGAVESSAKFYGVKGQVGSRFLATVWIATVFAIVSGFFWIFTICCCKPDRRQRNRNSVAADGEKLLPTGSYRPISNNHIEMTGGQGGQKRDFYDPNQANTEYSPGFSPGPRYPSGQGRTNLAYEPYSHRA